MKVITYNVNGIRAAMRKGLCDWLQTSDPDIVCLQEVKANPDQIDIEAFENLGYNFELFPAEKKGYSGVAILSKEKCQSVEKGLGISEFDNEGRSILCHFEKFSILSVYMPSGASKPERQIYKLKWLEAFAEYINALKQEVENLIIVGDFNICHEFIDIHDPYRLDGFPGFTETERSWFSAFLNEGFVDAFRKFNPEPGHYSWWSYMADSRNRNLGWRIDYILASNSLADKIKSSRHLTNAMHSDHCPVLTEFRSV